MLKYECVLFPGETLESDLEDRILKKGMLFFDKIYAIVPEVFKFKLQNLVNEYNHRYHPHKLDNFSKELVDAIHHLSILKERDIEHDGDVMARCERIINFLDKTEALREGNILEIINPDDNIKSQPYYWDKDVEPSEKFVCIKDKFNNLSDTPIDLSNIKNYTPHLLYGNILEDLNDAKFRNIVKNNFSFNKVAMYKGQAEFNWFDSLINAEDSVERIPNIVFGHFCCKISSVMWAALVINHALVSSFRKNAIPICSNPILQKLMNRKIERCYQKIRNLDDTVPNIKKDLTAFSLAVTNLPNFELNSFEDVLDIRERLKDELLEFRQKMCEFAEAVKKEPYTPSFKNHLELIQRNSIQPAIENMNKRISSLDRRTLPKVIVAAAINFYLCIYPSLPPALELLVEPLSLLNIWDNYREKYNSITENNGFSLLLKIGNA